MKQKIIPFFVLMLFFASCNDNIAELPVTLETELEKGVSNFVITATIGSGTRTSVVYGNPSYAAGETSEWVAGDIIHLYFYDIYDNLVGNLFFAADSDGPVSTFSPTTTPSYWTSTPVAAPPPSNTYRVVAAYCEDGMVNFNNQIQVGTEITHIGEYDPMKAVLPSVAFDTDGNADINLSFSHLAPMLRFPITNDTGGEIRITAIHIRSSNAANQFYSAADYSYDPFHNLLPKDSQSSLLLSCNHKIANGKSTDFYMMIPGNITPVTTADFLIMVYYEESSTPGAYPRQEFNIPMSANAFLQTPFEGGKRYYFRLNVTGQNIVTTVIDNSVYRINTTTNTATLTELDDDVTGSVTIPKTVNYLGTDYDVVAIGDDAFKDQTGLTNVTFAADTKVESIGMDAFYGCSGLSGAFSIPKSIISIGHTAFYGTGITGLTFETGTQLASIGEQAFVSSSLTGNFTIPATVTYIGDKAFYGANITSVTFESGSQLATIGKGAFSGTDLSGTFTIPASVTFIGNAAFSGTFISIIDMYCPTPPTLDEFALLGLDNLFLNVPLSAAEAYKSTINLQSKGWDNSEAGHVEDLVLLPYLVDFSTARATNVTVSAVLY